MLAKQLERGTGWVCEDEVRVWEMIFFYDVKAVRNLTKGGKPDRKQEKERIAHSPVRIEEICGVR